MEKIHEFNRITERLKAHALKICTTTGVHHTIIPGISFSARVKNEHILSVFYNASVSVILEGRKYSTVGAYRYEYGAGDTHIVGVGCPSSLYILEGTAQKPFLTMSLDIDRFLLSQILSEFPSPASSAPAEPSPSEHGGICVVPTDLNVLAAFMRLADLLETPDRIAPLASSIKREIYCRLLVSRAGGFLRGFAFGSKGLEIIKAIEWLKDNFREPFDGKLLAQKAGMSSATFYRHFKELTNMSPLQYHKSLRLFEAKRCMLERRMDVTNAAFSVGYRSLTQFYREYKQLFGDPPRRDTVKHD